MRKPDPIETVDELTYRNYAFNRQRSPDVAPWRWIKIFGEAAAQMEERFQNEIQTKEVR